MKVKNVKYYNFHKSNEYDSLWQPGKSFVIDGKTPTEFLKGREKFSETLEREINNIMNDIDWYCEDCDTPEERERMLSFYTGNLTQFQLMRRENAIERSRKIYAPFRPSRTNSIFVCDEKSLPFWESIFKDRSLYEITLTGNIFKTNELLLPTELTEDYAYQVKSARKYWYPAFSRKVDDTHNEYLFQGKVKVLRKIK